MLKAGADFGATGENPAVVACRDADLILGPVGIDVYKRQNYELYETVGDKKAEEYRKDYLFFKKLKDSVSLRFNDSVDFSKYEDGIRHLLNTYVNAEDAKIVIEPLDILLSLIHI